MNLMDIWGQMSFFARVIAGVLFVMSMLSIGVAVERIYTFVQARKQSKLYAPQVAKHLKDGRLKDAIAISTSKNYRYSHLAKVVLAGLQEYQFQQESGAGLSREDLMDTVRRAIQRHRSSGCWARSSASSTRSRASRLPARVESARCRPVSRKLWLRPRSACSLQSPRCGSITTSRAASSTSTSRWTTRRPSWLTTSSRRRRSASGDEAERGQGAPASE